MNQAGPVPAARRQRSGRCYIDGSPPPHRIGFLPPGAKVLRMSPILRLLVPAFCLFALAAIAEAGETAWYSRLDCLDSALTRAYPLPDGLTRAAVTRDLVKERIHGEKEEEIDCFAIAKDWKGAGKKRVLAFMVTQVCHKYDAND